MSDLSQITPDQISYRKKIGTLDGAPVIEVGLIGGFHMVVSPKGGKVKTLGTGPHRCVARHIAKKRNPEIEFTDLAKADFVELAHFAEVLPKYEAMTDDFNKLEG